LCFPPTSEKLSEELITISDAESVCLPQAGARQMKEPQARPTSLSYLEKHKGAVRRTLLQVRSEAHDIYMMLAVVGPFSALKS